MPGLDKAVNTMTQHINMKFDTLDDSKLLKIFGPILDKCFSPAYPSGTELLAEVKQVHETWLKLQSAPVSPGSRPSFSVAPHNGEPAAPDHTGLHRVTPPHTQQRSSTMHPFHSARCETSRHIPAYINTPWVNSSPAAHACGDPDNGDGDGDGEAEPSKVAGETPVSSVRSAGLATLMAVSSSFVRARVPEPNNERGYAHTAALEEAGPSVQGPTRDGHRSIRAQTSRKLRPHDNSRIHGNPCLRGMWCGTGEGRVTKPHLRRGFLYEADDLQKAMIPGRSKAEGILHPPSTTFGSRSGRLIPGNRGTI
ncbi:hypothetical protein B0H17DRAFT_1236097 [Mycena rosella]|uniref:Uncharacterized protein n=1 Tax=Mycena rosella TaxID=1033263 RepID=A0AAD7D7N6_MYCRO|nr:hypothetical protein B0H17DRAFT_1236097 [Mycena rosella]